MKIRGGNYGGVLFSDTPTNATLSVPGQKRDIDFIIEQLTASVPGILIGQLKGRSSLHLAHMPL